MIGWILVLSLLAFFLYYGYHLLVKRGSTGADADARTTACHLCRKKYLIRDMVAREKDAGFVNYFCADCVEQLFSDLRDLREG